MNCSGTSRILLAGLVAALASVYGCGSRKPIAGGSAGNGVAGSGGMAGSTTAGTAGAAGQSTAGAAGQSTAGEAGQSTAGEVGNDGSTGGMAGSTDAGIADATGDDSGGSADAGVADATGNAGATGNVLGFGGGDITRVVPTPGCGKAPGGFTPGTLVGPMHIMTMGTKAPNCADSKCGDWTDTRDYWVRLPYGYDMTKAYPLVFEGPGCGGRGNNLYTLTAALNGSVIRVGLSPSVIWQAFHATNPGQGCFDESDGDNSVEWPFYENLYDRLAGQLCFDRNRVFATGAASGGGRFADELACKYAGDVTRPVRGAMSNAGDWSDDRRAIPTCTTKPTVGMWVHQIGDATRPWGLTKLAVARAMAVNKCTLGTSFDDAMFDNFDISVGNLSNPSGTCKKIRGCPDLTPLVVCLLPGNAHASNDNVVNPGWTAFVTQFENPPLLTP